MKGAVGRGTCSVCGQRKCLRRDGKIFTHRADPAQGFYPSCAGSGKSPAPTPQKAQSIDLMAALELAGVQPRRGGEGG